MNRQTNSRPTARRADRLRCSRSEALALSALDDRLLADIGLCRSEVEDLLDFTFGATLRRLAAALPTAWPAGRPVALAPLGDAGLNPGRNGHER